MAAKVERQEIWGKFYDSPVTARQAALRIIGQVALMAVVVNLFRVFMNDEVTIIYKKGRDIIHFSTEADARSQLSNLAVMN